VLWAIPALRRAPYGLVAALMLVRFADEWTTFLPAGALEPIRHDLGLTYAEVSGVLVALSAGGLVGTFFVIAADYVSRRVLASLGAATYGLAMIAFGVGHSLPVLLAAAFAWGAASDAFVHASEVALVDLAEDALAKTLARMNAWAAVGDLLGPATLAAAALLGFGWRGAFLGGGAAMLGYAAWLAAHRFPPPHPPKGSAQPFAGVWKDIWAIAGDREVLLLAAVLGLFSLLDEPLDGFMIAYFERVRGLTPALASAPVVALLVGGMIGFAAFVRLTGARSPRTIILACAALMAATLPVAIYAPNMPLQLAAALADGMAGAVLYTTLESVLLALRPGQAGATSAVVSTVGMAGMAVPALVGALADARGLGAGLALYAAVPPIVLMLAAWWRRGRRRPARAE
jgi:predicted MFS family arabinose efflux permease